MARDRRSTWLILAATAAALIVVLALGGLGGATPGGGAARTAVAGTPGARISPTSVAATVPATPAAGVAATEAARREAATRLGVPAEFLTVARVERRLWRGAALGCAPAGGRGVGTVTPGYLVVLVGGGRVVAYRTDLSGSRLAVCGGG